MIMTPVTIAALNTVFRVATVVVLFPFIPKLEKLVCMLVKNSAEELEDVLPEYKIAAGVYAPNDEIYGKFHVLLPVNEKTKRTLVQKTSQECQQSHESSE